MSEITISIVSHGQLKLASSLFNSLRLIGCDCHIVLTLNIPEILPDGYLAGFSNVDVIENSSPMGFGANHNQAFKHATGKFFCVLNPDIVITEDLFSGLINLLEDNLISIAAPKIVGSDGDVQDSVRRYPSLFRILKRVLIKKEPDYDIVGHQLYPDWVAGMFMLFKSDDYKLVNGFDERYFMYCEDADICFRLNEIGKKVLYCPSLSVIHNAQRSSHENKKYLWWHLKSLLRFFISHPLA